MGCKLLIGLGCLAIAFGTYSFMEFSQTVFNKNKRLANHGKSVCTDINIADIGVDTVSGNCYSVRANFKVASRTSAPNILPEAISGHCMKTMQTIQQWQHYTVEVCENRRMGGSVESRTFDFEEGDYSEDEMKDIEKFKRNSNCHQESRYGWRSQEHTDNGNPSWTFPSADQEDRGSRDFDAAPADLRFHDYADGSASVQFGDWQFFDTAKMLLAHVTAHVKTGTEQIHVWNATNFDRPELCIADTTAFNSGGLSNSAFMASGGYADTAYYPTCESHLNQDQIGNYKVRGDCNGREDDDIRIVGILHKNTTNGDDWRLGPFSDATNHPDIESSLKDENDNPIMVPVTMFVWETDGSVSTSSAIDNHIAEMAAILAAIQQVCYFVMGFFGLVGITCIKKDGDDDGSSKSSKS